MKGRLLIPALLWAAAGWAGYRPAGVTPLAVPGLPGSGVAGDPQWSPDGRAVSVEFLGGDGTSEEVYVADVVDAAAYPPRLASAAPVVSRTAAVKDPFALRTSETATVSESLSWAPPRGRGQRVAVAATREAVERGAPQVSFDIYVSEPGRKRFLTTSRDNDAHPAFSPDGEYLAFSSGSTGQGDLYLYHFFADADPLVQVTFEAAGSEIFPAWDAKGERLAFTGHLGSSDHVYVIDDVRALAAERDAGRRRSLARRLTRDVTPGWTASCLAPSFSPDGRWVAFYSRQGSTGAADLYVVPSAGGPPRRLLADGLPELRRGPRWSPLGDGLFAVLDSAERMNPLVWVPLSGTPRELETGTQLNADPCPRRVGDAIYLLFTAQGSAEGRQKRWRKPYVTRLVFDRGN
ncbi:MAG: PD40 domain-containing protein [Deltaproteobacteria bacterium]|nr:PD40 domain-containing protein [Deltaproteobacteria bacterium]